ncbi:NDMA-dependent alcohol dehydrogenase [Rhodococcus jostii]|uniref:NDMA-dependent alcohol dehydrogenase n=1 Tax=Rhodococcus jostii TaxID=132919 RepID=UPI00366444C4
MVQTSSALLFEQPGEWLIKTVELSKPGVGEVLVEMRASGLCHSDDHLAQGDLLLPRLPLCGGHEGAGIVREVGPNVDGLEVGDHIVTSFVPACGHCRWCASGMQNLCDYGALILNGTHIDGNFKGAYDGRAVGQLAMLGTFSEVQLLNQLSCVKIDKDIPLDVACLVGCGVPTGWGSAVYGGQVHPGDVVIVMGTGGVGMNAVQGARFAGAGHVIAVDPVSHKRDVAKNLGATETFDHIDEAADFARSITNGQGADSAIVTVDLIDGDRINEGFNSIRKGGTVVVTAQGDAGATNIPVNLFELSMYQKRIQGVLYGVEAPRVAIPKLLSLYKDGHLKLDELITTRYTLDKVNQGYTDMRNGMNIKGIIDFSL